MTLAVAKRAFGSPGGLLKNGLVEPDAIVLAFDTPLRWMAIAARGDVLLRVTFGHVSRSRAEAIMGRMIRGDGQPFKLASEREIADRRGLLTEWAERLRRYAAGEPVDFSDARIDDAHLTRFGRRITATCRRIAWGRVRTYGELAAECGSPGAARAVGQVMARNRFPLVVPCHRVVAAGGLLGGFSAPAGLRMKRRLLAMEGQALPLLPS